MEQWLTFAGLVLASIGLVYAAEQIRLARKMYQADFILKLDEQLRNHDDVHLKLRGGEWSQKGAGPQTTQEWAQLDKYMGLFERIQLLVDSKIISLKIINSFYGYRVANIVINGVIRQKKLVEEKDGWADFISLAKSLKKKYRPRMPVP